MSAVPPPRPLDHLVLAARDLEAQAAFYRRLGFTVGARNRHPWGTENHVVQLEGGFLELISTGPAFMRPAEVDPHVYSFPQFIADYLAQREGLAMLALASADARADAAQFRALGIGDYEPFHFERRGKAADGRDVHVAFTLAYARSRLIEAAGFFTCQQHNPDNFWSPAFQRHANGARRLKSAVMIADGPSDHAEFLSHFTRQREMLATSMGLEIDVGGGGRVEVLTPVAFQFHFGAQALAAAGQGALGFETAATQTRFAAFRIAVADLAAAEALLAGAGLRHERRDGQIVVAAADAFGVALSFEPA
ncbi:MAG: VOC family protein [Methylobacteriaceae bacterium]|nr:VOC family protein [Methylobacteriaceae bacterium]